LNQAVEVAESIHDPISKAIAFGVIAEPYAAFDKDKAVRMLNEADRLVQLAPEIGDGLSKNIVYLPLAMSCVAIGNKEKAEEILKRMLAEPEEILRTRKTEEWQTRAFDYQAQLLASLAPIFIGLGKRDYALQSISRSRARLEMVRKNSFDRHHGLEAIAIAYAAIGELEQASAVVGLIEPESARIAWGRLAKAYAQAGQIDRALEFSRKSESSDRVSTSSLCVARKYIDNGQREKAISTLREATSPQKKIEPRAQDELADVATLLAEAGAYRESLLVLKRINAPADSLRALAGLARVFAKSGQTREAEQLLGEADKKTRLSKKNLFNARDRWEVADAYAAISATQRSMVLLSEIKSFVLSDNDEMQRDYVLADVALTYSKIGMPDLALESMRLIRDPVTKVQTLVSFSKTRLGNKRTPEQWYCSLER
jgi:tetratricopeptide (TPR) repeat protein